MYKKEPYITWLDCMLAAYDKLAQTLQLHEQNKSIAEM